MVYRRGVGDWLNYRLSFGAKSPDDSYAPNGAIFNGLGGAASALIAIGEYWRLLQSGENIAFDSILIAILGILIGGVTFTGSVLAFAKLQELISGAPVTFPFQQPFNILCYSPF